MSDTPYHLNHHTHTTMNNETIKTYTEITPIEGLKLLVKSGGKPVDGLAFKATHKHEWSTGTLEYIVPRDGRPFKTGNAPAEHCAKVTELDPCKAPEGCPELEPWMAYVKAGDGNRMSNYDRSDIYRYSSLVDGWETGDFNGGGSMFDCHYSIDVRTDWAQEHFPEHCRIRDYQEPNPLDEWINERFGGRSILDDGNYLLLGPQIRELFELGQSYPKKVTL